MTEELAQELLRQWRHRVPAELIAFGIVLEGSDAMPDGWPYFLERPEKWSSTYTAWCDAGKPPVLDAETIEATL